MQNHLEKEINQLGTLKQYIQESELPYKSNRGQRGLLGDALTAIFRVNDGVYHTLDQLDENQQRLIQRSQHVENVMITSLQVLNHTEERLFTHLKSFQRHVQLTVQQTGNRTTSNFIQLHFIKLYEQARNYITELANTYTKLQYLEASNVLVLELVSPAQVAETISKSKALPPHLRVSHRYVSGKSNSKKKRDSYYCMWNLPDH